MDYRKIYDNLCLSRKYRGCDKESGYEVHHILPRSMGGCDKEDNLVKLTPREHYIAHRLLYKITKGSDKVSMGNVIRVMAAKNSREYEEVSLYFKYINKMPVKWRENYVYAKLLKFHGVVRKRLMHKEFRHKNKDYEVRLSTIFIICKSFIAHGLEGFTSVHRSKWKRHILILEKKGYLSTFSDRGRKFYKFNIEMFNAISVSPIHHFNIPELIYKSDLTLVKNLLLKYNSKDIKKSLYIEKSPVEGKYFLMPIVTGWIPSDKPFLSRKEITSLLKP